MIVTSSASSLNRFARLGGLLLVIIFGLGSAEADVKLKAGDGKRKKDDYLVPEAREVTTGFVAGQAVDIELTGAVGTLKQTEFVIRQLPEHGTLTNLRPHPRESNKSIITYTHGGAPEALADRFTYSVRVDAGPYSAPATVYLRGQRIEPILSVLKVPSFGRVFLGGESSGTVSVRNLGRAAYVMNMVWSEGWVGPAKLEVNPGDTVNFNLTFRPVRPGEVRHDIELQPGVKTSKMTLYGEGIRALTVSPSYLTLDYDRTSGARSGVLTLVNGRAETVKAIIKYPMRLLAPTEVEIGPQQKAEVLLQLPKTDVPQFLGEVVVEAEGISEKVAVQSRPKPAELKIVSPERGTLDFGQINQKSDTTRDMIIANTGGELLVVEVQARNPYNAEFAGQALRLDPGQQRSIKVSLRTEQLGNIIGDLRVVGGVTESVVALRAFVREPAAVVPSPEVVTEARPATVNIPTLPVASVSMPATSAPEPVAPVAVAPTPAPETAEEPVADAGPDDILEARPVKTKSQAAWAAFLATEGLPMPASLINPHLDRVNDVELVGRETSNFTIAWKKPGIAPAGWALEAASIAKDEESNLFVKKWNRLNQWKTVSADTDKVVVKVHSLRPASQYEMRIRGVDRDGKFSEPSPAFVITTPEPWRIPPWAWRSLIMAALAVVIYMLYRARRGDFEFA